MSRYFMPRVGAPKRASGLWGLLSGGGRVERYK